MVAPTVQELYRMAVVLKNEQEVLLAWYEANRNDYPPFALSSIEDRSRFSQYVSRVILSICLARDF